LYVAFVAVVESSVAVTATLGPLWQPVQRVVLVGVADAVAAVDMIRPAHAITSTAASSLFFKCDTSRDLVRPTGP